MKKKITKKITKNNEKLLKFLANITKEQKK